jgi:hypothetical protein
MSLFSEIEKAIERGFRRWTDRMFGEAQSNELLLVYRAILDDVESKVQTLARGRRVFPYSRVTVTLSSADADRRALYQLAFGERLEGEMRSALEGVGCEVPRGFSVAVKVSEEDGPPQHIEYGVDVIQPAASAGDPPRLLLVRGKAEHAEYVLGKNRTNIGRMSELTDAEHRVIRRNDIVFEEGGDEANATVSRKHAHIRLAEGDYRICDDGSEFGTRVFRDGRAIEIPPGNRRGEKLRPGDEIYLGRACLRYER